MADAPFCNVKIATPPADPTKQVGFEAIPPGSSLAQAIRIINNNFTKLVPQPGGNWVEQSRVVARTRVFNPNDSSIFVDVDQVQRLVMHDPITGATWVWNRTGNPGP